jgi:hypothetical protein
MTPEPLSSPFRAFKIARLVLLRGRVRLAPLHRREGSPGFYDASGFAICEEGHDHQPPVWSCTCGFHAVGEVGELWRLGWVRLDTPVLEVELSGRVVQHQHGLRAGFQEVMEVRLADRCHRCGVDATCIGSYSRRGPLGPSCRGCARRGSFEFADVERDIGVPVRLYPIGGARAPRRVERRVLTAQLVPPLLFAATGVLLGLGTGFDSLVGVAGLLAGGWLVPGRAIATRIMDAAELSLTERHRLLGFRAGMVLLVSLGCWGVTGFFGAILAGGM